MSVAERTSRRTLSDLFTWLEETDLWERTQGSAVKVEDFMDDGAYVIRADLPGIDPDRDLEVKVEEGRLVVAGERREQKHEKNRSEVRYGSFSRTVSLPAGVEADDVTAVYDQGVLEVRVPVRASVSAPRRIAVQAKDS